MEDFLGKKTEEQLDIIKAILKLRSETIKSFSARKISELCNVESKNFGGAFKALVNRCGDFPPLLLRAGRERLEMTDESRRYIQLWRTNSEFPWPELEETIKNFQK